ncbi:endo-1,4-beta-xylanase [Litchfieldia alkalitelluris]|uniref:endo-1,4-beta-xylanase n=1 Tax=Litchfieldia alkalitelluris TaxID=304268 RepID=UPI00195CE448|nr:endo-1,4-beta-xylanase [Litchfieldia alkalitelluris]
MSRKLKRFISLFLVAILLIPTGWVKPVAEAATNEDIPVLLYHRIVENPSNEWTDTSTETFEQTLKYLADNGYTALSSAQYVSILEGSEPAPENPILLTFDDATPDFITTALPLLKQYNMNSVLFVTSDWIGGGYSMSEEQLKSLTNEASVSIENHTKTHKDTVWGNGVGSNSTITQEQAEVEISQANTYLKGITGKDPVLMAYPYGSYNDITKQVNEANGIKYAFKVGYPNDGDFAMGRHYITTQDVTQIAAMIGGPTPEPTPGDETGTVYHETFENGVGVATQSGNAKLEAVSDVVFDGNDDGKALYVSNRTNDYDAADFNFSDIGLENGKTYTVTVTGYVHGDETVPAGGQAVLSTVNSYTWLSNVNFEAGKTFTLSKEFTVDTSKDVKLRVQSNGDGATVPFYIGDMKITAKTEPTTEKIVYTESFADGQGFASASGGVTLSPVMDKVFSGNEDGAALHVSNRNNDWDAVDFNFSDIGLENGKTYTVTVNGFVDSDETVPTGAQAVLSTVNSYTWLSNLNFEAGQPFTLTKEFTVDTSKDSKLRVQSNSDGAKVSFYLGEVVITEKTTSGGGEEEPEVPRDPAKPFTTITFEDGITGGFEGRAGTETLTVTNEANHTEDGSYALKVEGRTQAWHGPTLRIEQYVDKGAEYKISARVKLISPDTSQLQLSTQVGEGDGASYNNLQGKTVSTTDGWVLLEGTYRYSSVGNEYLTIYVESSNNATASYYIDDITFEPTGSAPIEIEDLTPIKDVYKDYFLIGNAVSGSEFEGKRLELLNKHHNLVTAENALKPGYTYNDAGEFDFTAEDELVQSALDQGLLMHGHVLVWHQQSREELHTDANGNPLSREEALANLRTHVQTVVEHFGPNVISWDVVNEAMNDNPPNPSDWKASLRQSGWLKAIGEDYIEQAYLAANEVIKENGWDIKLYYNDYNDDNQNKAEAIYQMVKEINEKYAAENDGELLIDGIGMQGHYHLNTNPENVRSSLEKFISLGVEVGVTELDIRAGENSVLTEEQAVAQGYLYAQLFQLYKEHADHISRVTFWGLNDATSWRAAQNPLLFDKDMQAKPAYYAVIDPDKFIEENQPKEKDYKQATAVFGTPVIDGTEDDVWSNAEELQVNQYQMAWQGANGVSKVLWDNENLYVMIKVSDSKLDKSSPNPWEQDSIEVFLDENNAKTSSYQDDDGQYRVNFDNETSFNPASIAEGFESATHVSGNGYTVEVKIPFKSITPELNAKIGYDLQINDGQDGARQSAASWNDATGVGYQDTSVFGELTLVGAQDPGTEEPGTEDPGTEEPGTEDPGTEEPGTEEPGTEEPGTEEPGKKDPVKNDGKKLPNTATNIYNWLLVGVMLIAAGAFTFIRFRKRASL